jgi:catechol 2,3-dioxygenase-like lactoylglutathione lyase family enzyme
MKYRSPVAGSVPLHYVGIRVTDLRRSLRFYTRALGLKETIRGDFRKYGRGIFVGLRDPRTGANLELNWYPPGSRFGTPYRPGDGLDHIGIRLGPVPRRTLEAEYRRLVRAGARPTSVTPEDTEGWGAYVQDPDGNWIEIFRTPTAAERKASRRAPTPRTRRRAPQTARGSSRRRLKYRAAASGAAD